MSMGTRFIAPMSVKIRKGVDLPVGEGEVVGVQRFPHPRAVQAPLLLTLMGPDLSPHGVGLTSIGFLGKKGEKGGASSRYLLR